MITWDNFYLFAVASICLWLTGAIFALRSSVRSRMAVVLTIAGITCLGISLRAVDISATSPTPHYGRDPFMVLFLYGYCRVIDLYSLEISMDTFFLHLIVHCLCNNQSAETGDT